MMKEALVSVGVAALSYFFYTVYRARNVMYRLRAQGKPMPPYNWATGHLLVIKEFVDKLPTDAVFNYVALNISRTFTKHGMFYLDFWPFMTPILVIKNPYVAGQIMGKVDARKPVTVRDAFVQVTGGDSLLTMAEQPWKQWRSIFAPGFSPAHILDQVPLIVDQGKTFCGKLREAARNGTLLQLEEATIRLTIDVISLVALNVRLNYQLQDGQFPSTMRSLIETVTFGQDLNPLQRWNPIRPFLVWKYGRTLNTYIRGELAKRFEERKSLIESRGRATDKRTGKSIASLALDEYITNHMQTETAKLDSDFERYASTQIRLFLVAGHDTTSSALTYTLHLLYKHPEFLARVRAEHDSVFGTDAGAAADNLSNDPTLLNQLPITSAAIKESLRLFPPAGGVREGSPDITLVAEDGTQYPTDGCAIWVLHEAVHRNPAYWPRADEFVPDRFLCEPEGPPYPTKGAWRAFEFGPHNCIGQTLALTEIKTLLVMVVRQFDLKEAYAEWDQSHPVAGLREANGVRAYQVSGGGGGQHPSCRYPCRISVRD